MQNSGSETRVRQRCRQSLLTALLALSPLVGLLSFEPAHAVPAEKKMAATVVSVTGSALVRQEDSAAGGGMRSLKVGAKVFEGEVINTPSNGAVKLLMVDKTIMDIGASALFKVRKFDQKAGPDRDVDVSIMYGSVRAAVVQPIQGKGSFKVRTSSATMGVRGTEFVVKSEVGDLKSLSSVLKNPDRPPPPPAPTVSQDGKAVAPAPAAKTEITVVQGKVDVEQPKPKVDPRAPASAQKAPPVVSLTAGAQLTTSATDAAPAKPVQLSASQVAQVASSAKVVDTTFKTAISLDLSAPNQGGGSGESSGSGQSSGSGGGASSGGNSSAASGSSGSAGSAGSSAAAGAAPAAGGGLGGFGGAVNVTQAVIMETISAPPVAVAAPPSVANAGFAGTFGASNVINSAPPVNLIVGGLKTVRVIIER